MRLLKVLFVFAFGSLAGLVSLSHLLGYVLKRYKKQTYAVIIGFITGSLGMVWPWKEKIYRMDEEGQYVVDVEGKLILDNYSRYLPDLSVYQTWLAIFYIILGILFVLGLAWYEKRNLAK
jgi:hypothetical protein